MSKGLSGLLQFYNTLPRTPFGGWRPRLALFLSGGRALSQWGAMKVLIYSVRPMLVEGVRGYSMN